MDPVLCVLDLHMKYTVEVQIYYWQCLGSCSPKKGMLISVLSPAGYFINDIAFGTSLFVFCDLKTYFQL